MADLERFEVLPVADGDLMRVQENIRRVLNPFLDRANAALGNFGEGEQFLPLSGGTLTGSLLLAADPAAALEAVTRRWVGAVALEKVVVDSAVGQVDLTVGFDTYEIILVFGAGLVPVTDNVTPFLRLNVGGAVQSANYDNPLVLARASPSALTEVGSGSRTGIGIGQNQGSAAGENMTFAVMISPRASALYNHVTGISSLVQNAGEEATFWFSGSYRGAAGAIEGLRFLFTSGNIASGALMSIGFKGS